MANGPLSGSVDPPNTDAATVAAAEGYPRSLVRKDFCVLSIDRQWRVIHVAACPTYTPIAGPLVGQVLWDAYPGLVGSAVHAELKRAMEKGEVGRWQGEYQPRSVWVELRVWPADHGVTVFVHDITTHRMADDDQESLKLEKERVEAASAAKDQFMAVLSHELRTPLTPVLMAASALEQDSTLPPAVREELGVIRRNVELEARLIDDLLDMTRITRGKMTLSLQTTDAHSLVGHALYIAREGILAKRQRLKMELRAKNHTVRGDPIRLQQVFWNLLKNAVKFTPEGGTLTVRSRTAENGALRLEFVDSGIGIQSAAIGKIFNAFEQAGSGVTKAFGGLGLGLAICKALVEMHGGRIWAESDGQDRGATFVVELPTVADAAAGEANAPAAGAPSPADLARRLAILVVEDHESTAKILAKLLRAFGHDVSTAGSVQEATREAGKKQFDLLISDLGLPDGNGVDLLGKLKKLQPAVKGIALSGYGMEEDVRKTTEAGFAAHLIKPVALQQLKQAIADVAGRG